MLLSNGYAMAMQIKYSINSNYYKVHLPLLQQEVVISPIHIGQITNPFTS